MPVTAVRHQHRHFKTLIVLVVSMTGGTMFLFWLGRLTPAIPLTSLRGERTVTMAKAWDEILVRAQHKNAPKGFFHFRIDEDGRLTQSEAWQRKDREPKSRGAIQVLISCRSSDTRITSAQKTMLARVLSSLRAEHSIPKNRVRHVPQR